MHIDKNRCSDIVFKLSLKTDLSDQVNNNSIMLMYGMNKLPIYSAAIFWIKAIWYTDSGTVEFSIIMCLHVLLDTIVRDITKDIIYLYLIKYNTKRQVIFILTRIKIV